MGIDPEPMKDAALEINSQFQILFYLNQEILQTIGVFTIVQ